MILCPKTDIFFNCDVPLQITNFLTPTHITASLLESDLASAYTRLWDSLVGGKKVYHSNRLYIFKEIWKTDEITDLYNLSPETGAKSAINLTSVWDIDYTAISFLDG